MKAVVVSFDRLHLGSLGCYGNLCIESPHWNRLASESAVFENHFGENFDPGARNHAWWTGYHQFPHPADEQVELHDSLIEKLRLSGIGTKLVICEDAEVPAASRHFDDISTVPAAPRTSGEDATRARTSWIAAAQNALAESVADADRSELLWLHCSLSSLGCQTEPAATLEVSHGEYASQRFAHLASHSDRILGELFEASQPLLERGDCLLIVTAAAGELRSETPIAEDESHPLHEDLIHTPLCLRLPDVEQTHGRYRQLVQAVDLAPTLLDWFRVTLPAEWIGGSSFLPLVRGEQEQLRDAVMLGYGPESWAIRTEDLFYVTPLRDLSAMTSSAAENVEAKLFLKPEDRWEVDDVISRFSDAAEVLDRELKDFVKRQRQRARSSVSEAR